MKEQFQEAINKHKRGVSGHCFICDLRDELQWQDKDFDRFLDIQMTAGSLAGSSDYPEWFTEDHFKRSFLGSDEWLYTVVRQREPLISVEENI